MHDADAKESLIATAKNSFLTTDTHTYGHPSFPAVCTVVGDDLQFKTLRHRRPGEQNHVAESFSEIYARRFHYHCLLSEGAPFAGEYIARVRRSRIRPTDTDAWAVADQIASMHLYSGALTYIRLWPLQWAAPSLPPARAMRRPMTTTLATDVSFNRRFLAMTALLCRPDNSLPY